MTDHDHDDIDVLTAGCLACIALVERDQVVARLADEGKLTEFVIHWHAHDRSGYATIRRMWCADLPGRVIVEMYGADAMTAARSQLPYTFSSGRMLANAERTLRVDRIEPGNVIPTIRHEPLSAPESVATLF